MTLSSSTIQAIVSIDSDDLFAMLRSHSFLSRVYECAIINLAVDHEAGFSVGITESQRLVFGSVVGADDGKAFTETFGRSITNTQKRSLMSLSKDLGQLGILSEDPMMLVYNSSNDNDAGLVAAAPEIIAMKEAAEEESFPFCHLHIHPMVASPYPSHTDIAHLLATKKRFLRLGIEIQFISIVAIIVPGVGIVATLFQLPHACRDENPRDIGVWILSEIAEAREGKIDNYLLVAPDLENFAINALTIVYRPKIVDKKLHWSIGHWSDADQNLQEELSRFSFDINVDSELLKWKSSQRGYMEDLFRADEEE